MHRFRAKIAKRPERNLTHARQPAEPGNGAASDRMTILRPLLLALLLGLNPSLFAQETREDKPDDDIIKEIKDRENQYTDGLLRRDFEKLASIFADTYVNTSPSGQLRNKTEFLEALKADTSRISEIKENDKQTHVYGNTAVVTVEFEVRGTDQGESFEFKGRATDIWVKQNGQWFCVAVHSCPRSVTSANANSQ
jgi:ketosteroid isomerase-like protein